MKTVTFALQNLNVLEEPFAPGTVHSEAEEIGNNPVQPLKSCVAPDPPPPWDNPAECVSNAAAKGDLIAIRVF